ncbi:MAG: DUF2877 domain-containing protein [Chloroflexota bacterium]
MPEISVLTASPKTLNWLDQIENGRVLNIFPDVLNLTDNSDQILSIVAEKIGNGPFSLVVEAVNFAHAIGIEDQISFKDQSLKVGRNIFSTKGCQIWNPVPNWVAFPKASTNYLIIQIEGQLSEVGVKEGFIEVFYPEKILNQTKFYSKMESGSSLLLDALMKQDEGKLISAAGSLAGLGVGLTPSGDDFLVGVIYALWAVLRREEAVSTAESIWTGAARRTTSLSRAWLAAAVAGETGEPWHKFINAVIEQNEEKIMNATNEILLIGATSGADAICGFVQALKILEER